MKSLKSLVLASSLLASFAGSALANTTQYVEIVGAPAFRQDSNTNISAYVTSLGGTITATTAPSLSTSDVTSASANQWLIPNGVSTGVDLEIDASYTGSSAGIESVSSNNLTQKFIAHNTGTTLSGTFAQTAGTAYQPQITLSDTYQATTFFNGTQTFYGGAGSTLPFTNNYGTLDIANNLGIEPYHFVASPGAAAAGLTNITTAQAQNLFSNGRLPLAFFTGNSADHNKYVYGLLRDNGSGSRLVAQAEVGIGTALSTPLKLYTPTVSGGTVDSFGSKVSGTVTANGLSPAGKVPSTGIYVTAGYNGYPKFGTTDQTGLLLAITSTPQANQYFITFLNNSDDNEAILAGATELNYNGVPYSTAAVAEGLYTAWSYEWLFAVNANITGTPAATVATALSAPGFWQAAIAGSSVNVSRAQDGGIVTKTY
jgi:hypothetical protein